MSTSRQLERDRAAIALRQHGASFREIAEVFGLDSAAAAKGLYARAVARDGQSTAPAAPDDQPRDATFLAWAAGFFDGEGCISAGFESTHAPGQQIHLTIILVQVTPEPVELLHRHWGGTLRSRVPANVRHQPQWRWVLSGRNAAPFLSDVLPYLVVKRELAELALALTTHLLPHGKRVPPETAAARAPIVRAIQSINGRRHTKASRETGRVA